MKLNRAILILAVGTSLVSSHRLAAADPPRQAKVQRAQTPSEPIEAVVETPVEVKEFNRVVIRQVPQGRFLSDEDVKKLSPEARKEVEKLLKDRPNGGWAARARIVEGGANGDGAFEVHQRPLEPGKAAPKLKVYRYMIGVAVKPTEADADKPDETAGVEVTNVVEETPAAKAEIKEGDLILKVDEAKIGSVEGLMDAVEASKGEKLTVRFLRGDEEKTVEIQPVERPHEYLLDYSQMPYGDVRQETGVVWNEKRVLVDQDLDQFLLNLPGAPGMPPKAGVRIHAVHPGVLILDRHRVDLPENLSIKFLKTGSEPAKITVTRKEQTWDVTEETLDQLPEDVRPYVKGMIGESSGRLSKIVRSSDLVGGRSLIRYRELDAPVVQLEKKKLAESESVQQQIKELRKQLERQRQEMQRMIEQETQMMQKLLEQVESSQKEEKGGAKTDE